MVTETHPFETIESTHEFIALLASSIDEAAYDVAQDLEQATVAGDERRTRALQLALFKLNQLGMHVSKSRRLLNDLRTIRRLLFEEREQARGAGL
jgi:hypothetical protein